MKNVMIALDDSQAQESLLKHAALFINKLGAEKALLLHIVPIVKIADTVTVTALPPFTPAAPAVEIIREKIEDQANVLKRCCKKAEITTVIQEGQPFPSLVKSAAESQADLLIMRIKKVSGKSGITAKKIARKVSSDLLFVPDRRSTAIEQILVAVDFSENSARAVRKALILAKELKIESPIRCLHILDIPVVSIIGEAGAYNLTGTSILDISKAQYAEFVKKHDLDDKRLKPLFVNSWIDDLGATILSTAQEVGADLIVVGAQGHSLLRSIFLGSVTESLVAKATDDMIWVVR